jgi:zinc transport system substrate-binding protein
VQTVIEGTAARAAVLDPLGAHLPAGPDTWFTVMEALARNLAQCLVR